VAVDEPDVCRRCDNPLASFRLIVRLAGETVSGGECAWDGWGRAMTETWRHPEAIVSGDWLEAHLADPDLRIYDCTTYLRYEEGAGRPYRVESGRADWQAGHIPGAMHLDLQADFSVDDAPTRFMRRSPEKCAAAFARHGVAEGTRVILYSRKSPQWATRFWWMLRWIGFDDAAVLDGGMDRWEAEGRPIATEAASYSPGRLTARPRPGLFVGKDEMLAAIGDGAVCSLNALDAALHSGENPRYGRPGRIPGSTNVPAASLLDPATKTFCRPTRSPTPFARPVPRRASAFSTTAAEG
jgi:thiosulfate/3-mercaptopyruvate sulfurtransferase